MRGRIATAHRSRAPGEEAWPWFAGGATHRQPPSRTAVVSCPLTHPPSGAGEAGVWSFGRPGRVLRGLLHPPAGRPTAYFFTAFSALRRNGSQLQFPVTELDRGVRIGVAFSRRHSPPFSPCHAPPTVGTG